MATPDSSGVQRRRVRSDGKLIRPQNHRASRPVNRPRRNPPTGVASRPAQSAHRYQSARRGFSAAAVTGESNVIP
jgi:hypothetical protein